jgi:hypothetical protein
VAFHIILGEEKPRIKVDDVEKSMRNFHGGHYQNATASAAAAAAARINGNLYG